jgi:hypothetical protein
VTEIVADNVEFIDRGDRKERRAQDSGLDSFGEDFSTDGFQSIEDDDDIPF